MTPKEKNIAPIVTIDLNSVPLSVPMCRSGRLRYARDQNGVQRLQEEWVGGGKSEWTWVPGWEQEET